MNEYFVQYQLLKNGKIIKNSNAATRDGIMYILTSAFTLYNKPTADIGAIDDLSTYWYGDSLAEQPRTDAETDFYYIIKNGYYGLREACLSLSEQFLNALFVEFDNNMQDSEIIFIISIVTFIVINVVMAIIVRGIYMMIMRVVELLVQIPKEQISDIIGRCKQF